MFYLDCNNLTCLSYDTSIWERYDLGNMEQHLKQQSFHFKDYYQNGENVTPTTMCLLLMGNILHKLTGVI